MSKQNEQIKQYLVIIATFGVIFVNFLAGTGRINNTTPGEISEKYQTAITPAGYAFSIWSLIYLGLIAFSIYQAFPSQKNNPRFLRLRTLYVLNCVANCAWIYFWHYDFIAISLLAMFFILLSLILINFNLRGIESASETWTTKVPFNIYFGWITVATILNAWVVLVYLGIQLSETVSTILAFFSVSLVVVLAFIIRRNFDFPSYALTIAWALMAIAIGQYSQSFIMITAILGSVIAVLIAFLGRKRV